MSGWGRFSLWVILLGLAFIVGLRAYRAYEQRVQLQQEEEQAFSHTFHQVPLRYERPTVEMPVFKRFSPGNPPEKDIFLEDAPLTTQQRQEQARQTIHSILKDYQDNVSLKAFYEDVRQSTGADLDLVTLSQGNIAPLLQQYPQLQEVIARHAKDPKFVRTMQEILSNPQFMSSVAILQQQQTDRK